MNEDNRMMSVEKLDETSMEIDSNSSTKVERANTELPTNAAAETSAEETTIQQEPVNVFIDDIEMTPGSAEPDKENEVASNGKTIESSIIDMEDETRKRPASPSNNDVLEKKSKLENENSLSLESSNVERSSAAPLDSSADNAAAGDSTTQQINIGYEGLESSIAKIIQEKLEPLGEDITPLRPLSLRDLAELENSLQLGDKYDYSEDDGWKKDWSGNLHLFEKDVVVNSGYATKHSGIQPFKLPFYEYVAKSSAENQGLRGLELLFAYVYHTNGCPAMARKILAHALSKPSKSNEQRLDFIIDAIRRITYDPAVLKEDGWITKKAETPQGAMGGAHLIGKRIIWQRHDAVIIAFTPDETWGSLWKALWIEDLDTFDLEADEVKEALIKYEKKQARLQKKAATNTAVVVAGSTRKQATAKYLVPGIEHGIVLALSARSKGVLWPARILHVSEMTTSYSGSSRRNSTPTKAQVQVVFLAPFWNGNQNASTAAMASDPFSLGPYFEVDTIDVTDVTIKKYPFDSFSVEDIQSQFRFLGLPQAVLSRFLDANRLAMALKVYARKHVSLNYLPGDEDAFASASLTGSHAMSVLAPIFPAAVLGLPYEFILKQLPRANEHASALIDNDETAAESVIDIKSIIDSMTPPSCFGKKQGTNGTSLAPLSPDRSQKAKIIMSPLPNFTPLSQDSECADDSIWSISNFASTLLVELFETSQTSNLFSLSNLVQTMNSLLMQMKDLTTKFDDFDNKKRKEELSEILRQCLLIKGHGEDVLSSSTLPPDSSRATITTEWRKACERIYKRAVDKLRFKGGGNGHTTVISDTRCNGHITAENAYERPVRLPAAIKGAKQAGAGTDPNVLLVNSVQDMYVGLAENKVIPKAHQRSYVKRLKSAISAITDESTGVQLTDDSEGEGGDDTKGSRGSYTAATVGVAAALQAVDMVVRGETVNAFCATRPPGHHAGRELHPMKAVSNGFCLFNAAACAAIYAATPQSQGGLGLRRVCIVDFDLHHGNGTQDILCNTHDPRFLYVSMHVGGAHINGFEVDGDESFHLPGTYGKTTEGIFPGRCGDTSPHEGVLNIPLGNRIKSSDVGTALVSQVVPKVEAFCPDLIILSAGFDAHVNDPLGMGGLTAADFGHVTDVVCQLAHKTCSGRVISVLEGGYGVPCCRPRTDIFLPEGETETLMDLGDDLPANMPDSVTNAWLRQKLNKCHAEGFMDCVKEHCLGLIRFNSNKRK